MLDISKNKSYNAYNKQMKGDVMTEISILEKFSKLSESEKKAVLKEWLERRKDEQNRDSKDDAGRN